MARATGLEAFQQGLQDKYGKTRAPDKPLPMDYISTGSLMLDWALRRGGWPTGRIVELWGPPDTGKSTIAICSMRQAQLKYPKRAVAYVDMEGTFEEDWAEANGLDMSRSRWEHLYPDHSEQASDMARTCCMSGHFSLVVLDSIGGMESKKAFEDKKGDIKDAEDDIVAANAKVITRMVKHFAKLARETRTTVLLVNQPRAVIGSAGFPDQPSGPRAQQHASTTRVRMSKGSEAPVKMRIDGVDERVAVQVKATVDRSKQVAVGRVAEIWVNTFPTTERGPLGIDQMQDVVEFGIRRGVIIQKNSYYQVPTQPQVNGKEKLREQVRANPELLNVIRERIFEQEGAS